MSLNTYIICICVSINKNARPPETKVGLSVARHIFLSGHLSELVPPSPMFAQQISVYRQTVERMLFILIYNTRVRTKKLRVETHLSERSYSYKLTKFGLLTLEFWQFGKANWPFHCKKCCPKYIYVSLIETRGSHTQRNNGIQMKCRCKFKSQFFWKQCISRERVVPQKHIFDSFRHGRQLITLEARSKYLHITKK